MKIPFFADDEIGIMYSLFLRTLGVIKQKFSCWKNNELIRYYETFLKSSSKQN